MRHRLLQSLKGWDKNMDVDRDQAKSVPDEANARTGEVEKRIH